MSEEKYLLWSTSYHGWMRREVLPHTTDFGLAARYSRDEVANILNMFILAEPPVYLPVRESDLFALMPQEQDNERDG